MSTRNSGPAPAQAMGTIFIAVRSMMRIHAIWEWRCANLPSPRLAGQVDQAFRAGGASWRPTPHEPSRPVAVNAGDVAH